MATQAELLQEAASRGLLDPQKQALFDEAARRGLLGASKEGAAEPSIGRNIGAARFEAARSLLGAPETALQLATGALALPLSGIAGAVGGLAGALAPGGETGLQKGTRFIEATQEALTFQPRTEVGQQLSEVVAAPFEALESVADVAGESVLPFAGPAAAAAVKTAILAAPIAFGLRGGLTRTRPATKPTPRQQVAAISAEEGYVTPPSVRGEAGLPGLAEGLGGKIKTKQQAIEANQSVTDKLASRAVGLPEEVPVTIDVLQGIRNEAAQPYEAVRGVGQVFTDTTFRKDLSAATARFRSAARDFPELAKSEIIDIVDGLRIAEFDAGAGIDAISLLRNRADVAFRGGDKTLGNAYRAASNAIEGVIERHLSRGGDPALIDGFRQARQQIATTYSVQEALQGRITGEVSATQLAAQLKKGKPLSGDLRTIADFANTFPTVSRLFTGTAQAFSPLDLFVGSTSLGAAATAAAFGAGPAALIPLAGTVARPLLRKGALSEVGRRRGLSRDRVRPSGGVITGAATTGLLADVTNENRQ